jgi:mannose/cellobiose epimerase-like protein (N-acyl-D-glucosamine 2-epimerase family)
MGFTNSYWQSIKTWNHLSISRRGTEKSNSPTWFRPSHQDLILKKEKLEGLLVKNILPFWYPKTVDWDDGGYRLNHDIHGQWRGPANKDVITQARTVWFFARLSTTRHGRPEHLDAARHGYEFLRDWMWDKEYGGFYWEVDSSGRRATRPDKHLCAQSFALYALCEYASASQDASVMKLALELFALLEARAHDSRCGGYREYFRRDWSFAPKDLTGYVTTPPDIKLMSTHLHLMEAVTPLFYATKDTSVKERLLELIFIQSSSLTHKVHGACTDQYHPDWTPVESADNRRVSFGHLLKTIWMLAEACATAGISNGPWLDYYRQAFQQALRYGFDRKRGGFYDAGTFAVKADRREKVWYIQAEGLLCALYMYRLSAEEKYWQCFSATLEWIVNRQADWEYGDWYWQIEADGKPSGDKARSWKGPYHNGRAVIRCLELLAENRPVV